jgi:hypothetical protein
LIFSRSLAHTAVVGFAINFGKWESGASKNVYTTSCHGHTQIYLSRAAVLALVTIKDYTCLTGHTRYWMTTDRYYQDCEELLSRYLLQANMHALQTDVKALQTDVKALQIKMDAMFDLLKAWLPEERKKSDTGCREHLISELIILLTTIID